MQAADLVALLIPVAFFGLMALEPLLGTGRQWPAVRWWRAKGVAFFVVLMTINAVLPSLLPPSFAQHSLLPGAALGVVGGTLVGYLVLSLCGALVHRAYHRYPLLWRIHQLHHAPQRMDMAGSAVFTPVEVLNNVFMSLAVTVLLLGLDPLAAALVGCIAAFYGMFQHFNARTPRWLGYVIQRPESHSVHHRRGFHAYNYSDLPLWDLLWGTFRNPGEFHGEVGFEQSEARRVGAMLVGRDVNLAALGPGSRGRTDPTTNPA